MSNHLQDKAGPLAAGHWDTLVCPTYDAFLTNSGTATNPGGSLTFACKAMYDWEERGTNLTHGGPKVLYFGAGHQASGGFGGGWGGGGAGTANHAETKFIEYDIRTNTARDLAAATFTLFDATHTYGFLACAPGRRKLYIGQSNSWVMYEVNIDHDDLNTMSNADWDASYGPVGGNTGLTTQRTSIEWFPERNSMIFYVDYGSPGFWEKVGSQSWQFTALPALTSTTDGGFCSYNSKHKCVLIGGGTNGGLNYSWYKIGVGTVGGGSPTITRLDDSPVYFNSGGYTLQFHDPIGGDYCFIKGIDLGAAGYEFWTLNPNASAGSQWTHRTDLENAIPNLANTMGYTDPCVCVTLWDYGVTMFLCPQVIRIYKHSANTRAVDGLSWTESVAAPGTVGNIQCDTQAEMNARGYSWNSLDTQLTSALNSLGISSNLPITGNRTTGEAFFAAQAGYSDTEFGIPMCDTSNPPPGNSGSLLYKIWNHTGGAQGYMITQFNQGLGLGSNFPTYWQDSVWGRQIYTSYQYKLTQSILSTQYWAVGTSNLYTGFGIGTIDHTVNSGKQVTCITGGSINADSSLVGRSISIQLNENGDYSVQRGFYVVASVEDANHFTLTTSPLTNAGVNGSQFRFGASSGGTQLIYGQKMDIMYGEPPFGGSSGAVENTSVNQQQQGYPDLYGDSGSDGPPNPFPQTTIPYIADAWKRVVHRVEPLLPSFGPNSHAELLYGGQRCRRWVLAKLQHGSGESQGIGSLQTGPYMTGKDGVQSHAYGEIRYAQFIWGTEPPSGLDINATTGTTPSSNNQQLIPFFFKQ